MASKKQYWRTLEEYNNPSLTEKLASKEFAEEIPVEDFLTDEKKLDETKTSRRDFLKLLGFSTAAVTLASCEAPIINSIPYVVKPAEVTPGIPTFYATTHYNGFDYSQVIIKTREGRPIKVEPQKEAKYFGSTSARTQASVLGLYDNDRVKEPSISGEDVEWSELDMLVENQLEKTDKQIVVLTKSLPSPSSKKVISQFIAKYPTAKHVVYDAVGYTNSLDAAEEVFGKRVLPHYDLKKANLVVSFNADFLSDWNAGGMSSDYAASRKPGEDMLRHIQVETNLSLTGSNADDRFPMKPSAVHNTLLDVYKAVSGGSATSSLSKEISKELLKSASKAVVFADGSKETQVIAHAINKVIGSKVISGKAIKLKEFSQNSFQAFLNDANKGLVGTLLSVDANPAYSYYKAEEVEKALEKIPFKVALNQKNNETSQTFNVFAPTPHWLECWGDFNPVSGVYALQQPTIANIFNTRQFEDSLLVWSGNVEKKTEEDDIRKAPVKNKASYYYSFLKKNWESNVLPSLGLDFNKALYNAVNEIAEESNLVYGNISSSSFKAEKEGKFELQLYLKPSIGDGSQANNPWLQEMPDPVTRTSWDNYATMHVDDAAALDIETLHGGNDYNGRMEFNGGFINITANGATLKVPVFIQPGQAKGTIGIALGYGREKAGKVADNVGFNAFPFYKDGNFSVNDVKIERTDGEHPFANIQVQNTLLGRYELAREVNLHNFINEKPDKWNPDAVMPTHRGEKTPVGKVDLWRSFDRSFGPHFNLSIDLSSCIGCGSCVIACQAENNVPVVGKQEIRKSRDMYWLRIDRYYSNIIPDEIKEILPKGDGQFDNKLTQKEALHDGMKEPEMYKILRSPASDNPDVIFQPVMCQHCNHAPCETVCPVAATVHGRQGQNMMTYNRCVGTRYCANNCPYKVRRFNWFNYSLNDKFDYHMNSDLGRMVLNPDVAVRVRGVMEKCSMCIQMTQRTISQAKAENRTVSDDEFQTACSNACGTGSIKFGDINDPESEVAELLENKRKYLLLEEIGTKPNVMYHTKVKNTDRKI